VHGNKGPGDIQTRCMTCGCQHVHTKMSGAPVWAACVDSSTVMMLAEMFPWCAQALM
jgi:hypothetical protein